MLESEKFFFVQELTALSEIYDKKNLSNAGLNIYWEDLQRYRLEDVKKALIAHRRDAKRGNFMPRPADIIFQLDNLYTKQKTKFACMEREEGLICGEEAMTNVGTYDDSHQVCERHFEKKYLHKTSVQIEFEIILKAQRELYKINKQLPP